MLLARKSIVTQADSENDETFSLPAFSVCCYNCWYFLRFLRKVNQAMQKQIISATSVGGGSSCIQRHTVKSSPAILLVSTLTLLSCVAIHWTAFSHSLCLRRLEDMWRRTEWIQMRLPTHLSEGTMSMSLTWIIATYGKRSLSCWHFLRCSRSTSTLQTTA